MNNKTISFEPPRGMRDFYPEEMRMRNYIFNAWQAAARHAGFDPYDACVVESMNLLERKSGEEVSAQIYHFKDKSGRKLALRPEMTPTLARMVAARRGQLSFPIKWYAVAQCFRYERMTRGRKREHYQWNLDVIGEQSVMAEIDVLSTAVDAMRRIGIPDDHWRIHMNNRALLGELLQAAQIPAEYHAAVFLALDKRDKISEEEIVSLLGEAGLDSSAIDKTFALLEVKTLAQAAALLSVSSPAIQRLEELFNLAKYAGIANMLYFDIGVIRGLAYYTDIVFEAFDADKKFRAIFGGGRYDNLLTSIGGSDTPAVGLGFGDVVINEILMDINKQEALQFPITLIGYMFPEQQLTAVSLAKTLREQGEAVNLMLAPVKPRQFFARASTSATSAIFLGPDDIAAGTARRKNLATREESMIKLANT